MTPRVPATLRAPLISVIVPLLNGEAFLARALGSIREQRCDPLEVIVVDNGSTDSGPEIARSGGFKVIEEQKRGAGSARNAGVRASSGTIVMFLDQDDVWLPGKVDAQVELLTERPDVVSIVYERLALSGLGERPAWLAVELLERDHPAWVPSSMAMTRATLDRVGPFDEQFIHSSDSDWFGRALDKGVEVLTIPRTLIQRTVHAESSSRLPEVSGELFTALRARTARLRSGKKDSS